MAPRSPIPEPTIYEDDVLAVRAVLAGKASEDQQRRCMRWITTEACRYMAVTPNNVTDREFDRHEGRRQVGALILLMDRPETLANAKKRGTNSRTTT